MDLLLAVPGKTNTTVQMSCPSILKP